MSARKQRSVLPWVLSIALHGAVVAVLLSFDAPEPPPRQPIEISLIQERRAPPEVPAPPRVEEAVEPRAEAPRPRRRAVAPEGPEPKAAEEREREDRGAGPGVETPAAEAPASSGARGAVTRERALELALPVLPGDPIVVPRPREERGASKDVVRLEPQGDGTFRHVERGFIAKIDRDGTVTFDDRSNVKLGGENSNGKGMIGFDLTEAVMSAAGQDPFAYDKAKFLEQTRELRNELCDRDRKERIAESLIGMKARLQEIWAKKGLAPSIRRRLLFDLWDECAESTGDETVARAGAMARATILGFIREHLPRGSSEAYPVGELLALNERRVSKERFEPYGAN